MNNEDKMNSWCMLAFSPQPFPTLTVLKIHKSLLFDLYRIALREISCGGGACCH